MHACDDDDFLEAMSRRNPERQHDHKHYARTSEPGPSCNAHAPGGNSPVGGIAWNRLFCNKQSGQEKMPHHKPRALTLYRLVRIRKALWLGCCPPVDRASAGAPSRHSWSVAEHFTNLPETVAGELGMTAGMTARMAPGTTARCHPPPVVRV